MRALVRQEMEAGALGIGSSLIYAPDNFASTEELIELCKVAAAHGGRYISHMRSEGNRLVEAVQELLRISREAKIPAEIYHLKAAGQTNWGKMDRVLELIEEARASGLTITADMYLYPAGSTGLNAAIPPSALEGGYQALFKRLRDPAERARIRKAMATPTDEWENLHLAAGSADRVLLVDFKNEKLKPLTGKTLAAVAKERGKDPFDTILDLMLEDESRVGAVYFLMSEDNISKQLKRSWVSLGSDAASMAPEGVFLKSSTHPRAYGNFAKLFAKYVRADRLFSIEEAIRRVTSLPGRQSRPRRSRQTAARPLCRRRRLQSRDHAGSRDVREATSAGGRGSAGVREWRSGPEGRRADREAGRAGIARPRRTLTSRPGRSDHCSPKPVAST